MLSSYSSRLPSLEPEDGRQFDERRSGTNIPHLTLQDVGRSKLYSPWRITHADYTSINGIIQRERNILPVPFELPSRHALNRYFEGYFTGFYNHLPFLHIPTLSLADISPALCLAIAAIGAQYRFEREEALRLYCASKAFVDYQIGLRPRWSIASTALGNSGQEYSPVSSILEPEGNQHDCHNAHRLELTQALIILMIFATYNPHSLLQDAFEMANCLVCDLREEKLLEQVDNCLDLTWEQWVRMESRRRTILGAFVFLHIQSIVYDIPPKLMSSEICLIRVPVSEALWRARNATEWMTMQTQDKPADITFGECYAAYFASTREHSSKCDVSPFGNLASIHAMIQQIYLAWELSFTTFSYGGCDEPKIQCLPPSMVTRFEHALGNWKSNWEATTESSIDPASSCGPLGFNSTALFRIACMRLHFNLGPHLKFNTRDPRIIAEAIRQAPLPARTPKLYNAILQSAHSLSIPVRLGVEYVARTQTLTWSIVHTLCNVECAFFLSKWLQLIALDPERLFPEEKMLLGLVNSVLCETNLKVPIQAEQDSSKRIKRIGIAIIKLLAQTLKGNHVFELVEILCVSLETYAESLEHDL
ncbi:hypothetical protein OIDMADRAFT_115738 [Oidiodendron maius Zn]|uniref:Xylanolytic transcriptional activator regulatory domain-containing protein n=1 Tax=Oidiodendron maius (strain Zn) TaxID=913774 RepID=A0A0C3HSN6_OIDMZ|nr:hypothetical protein OIDMADRAFT_115738 [Oidiodendron maius Zn]